MGFLNTALLPLLLPLLAVPVVIHLLNKRFPRRFEFPSVRHLLKAAAERSRIYRWRHRILSAVRTLFVLLLLLAFLVPLVSRFHKPDAAETRRRVMIVVDRSLSMEYQQAALSNRQRALIEARKLLATLSPEDEINIVAVSHAADACFTDFSRNHADARRYLDELASTNGRADFNTANITVGALLAKSKGPVELYYVSDFQRRNWAQVDFRAVADRATVYFIDAGVPHASNRAILSVEMEQDHVLAGDSVPLQVTVGNYSDAPLDDVLRIRVDQNIQLEHPVQVAPWASSRVTVPVPATSPGLHVCEVKLPPDGLVADDRWVLVLPVLEKEEIVTVSSEADATRDPVRYLHAALNPFPGQAGSLLPRHVASSRLDAAALAGASKVFLTRCGPIGAKGADALARYLHDGGGVVWFLDDAADVENLRLLGERMEGSALPLTVGPMRESANVGSAAQQIATGDFKSPLLRLFRGTLRQDLALLEFYDFHAASATGEGKVLLRFADETPAMAVAEHGFGTLVLMNFSVSEFSSNLARQRIFPAWVQDLVKRLGVSEPVPLAFTAGRTVEGEVWREDVRREHFTSPSGRVIDVRQEPVGERSRISFPAEETGFYTLVDGRMKYAYAVNPDPDESDLRTVDRPHLPRQVGREAGFVGGRDDYEELAGGRRVPQWFLLAALAALALELGLQTLFRRLAR